MKITGSGRGLTLYFRKKDIFKCNIHIFFEHPKTLEWQLLVIVKNMSNRSFGSARFQLCKIIAPELKKKHSPLVS